MNKLKSLFVAGCQKVKAFVSPVLARCKKPLVAVGLGGGVLAPVVTHAQSTDITGVITTVSTYETTGIVVGIAILLWRVGKRTVKTTTAG